MIRFVRMVILFGFYIYVLESNGFFISRCYRKGDVRLEYEVVRFGG